MYVCMYVRIYVSNTYPCMYVFTYVYMCATYVCVDVTYVCIYTCIYV